MFANILLIAGSFFVVVLSLGQLLIRRRNSANRILFCLFGVCSVWILHAVMYRLGLVHELPHTNKVYLPLLCVTGSLWYAYIRSLYDTNAEEAYNFRYLWPPFFCIVLSVPFYMQSATYKQAYIEVNVSDLPTLTMYIATRLAELTIIWFFAKSLYFLKIQTSQVKTLKYSVTSKLLWSFSAVALIASITRLIGSIMGNQTVSVLVPTALALCVIIAMHLMSYRLPVLLGLDLQGFSKMKSAPDSSVLLDDYRQQIFDNMWYLDPNLKVVDLGRKLGVSGNELSAIINLGTGKNYNEFINEFRIEHAKKLLSEEARMSVLDIAHESGFNSKSVFYDNFSSLAGTTPGKFRKALGREIA